MKYRIKTKQKKQKQKRDHLCWCYYCYGRGISNEINDIQNQNHAFFALAEMIISMSE